MDEWMGERGMWLYYPPQGPFPWAPEAGTGSAKEYIRSLNFAKVGTSRANLH